MDVLPSLSLRYAEVAAADPSTHDESAIAVIIAYHRKNRANLAEGIKPKRGKKSGPSVKIDLLALGLIGKTPPKPMISGLKRRI
jgi:hypothetical protein